VIQASEQQFCSLFTWFSFDAGFPTALLLASLAALLATPAWADEPSQRRVLSLGDVLPCNENPCAYLVYVHEDIASGEEAFAKISKIAGKDYVELIQTNTYSGKTLSCLQASGSFSWKLSLAKSVANWSSLWQPSALQMVVSTDLQCFMFATRWVDSFQQIHSLSDLRTHPCRRIHTLRRNFTDFKGCYAPAFEETKHMFILL
jgi:hypothetical protein